MKTVHAAALSFALITLCGVTQSALAGPMSLGDKKVMESCMAMPEDAMMADHGCADMMKKMNMSAADMKTTKSCMAMSSDDMMKDTSCAAMMKAHPEMFSHKGGAM